MYFSHVQFMESRFGHANIFAFHSDLLGKQRNVKTPSCKLVAQYEVNITVACV